MNFDKLFEPIQIGTMELKNRIAMAPMNMAYTDPLGYPGDQVLAWYATRARGVSDCSSPRRSWSIPMPGTVVKQ